MGRLFLPQEFESAYMACAAYGKDSIPGIIAFLLYTAGRYLSLRYKGNIHQKNNTLFLLLAAAWTMIF